MSNKNTSVFGIFLSQTDGENAMEALKLAGFRGTDISVLFSDNTGTKDLAVEKNTKAPEGTVTGAASGAVVGGVLGWLAGMGALMIPETGALMAAGPMLGMLSGMGAGSVLGGIVGALVGMTQPEYEAKRFEGRIRKSGVLMSVHCDDPDWVKTAKTILEQTGAEDIGASTEAKADFASSDRPRPRKVDTTTTAKAS